MFTDFDKFCSKKGYAMVKLFGFMLAVAAMVSSANAALLVSYEFTPVEDKDPKDPTFASAGIDALTSDGSFSSLNDRLQGTVSNSTTIRQERFGFSTTAPNFLKLSTMTFDTALVTGTRPVSFMPTFKLNGTTVASNLYTVSPASGYGAYTVTFTSPFTISGGSNFEAAVNAVGLAGSGSTTFAVDNVKFNGDVIPEPASIAVFGLLGAGVAFRRLRRKA
jgi:hypothetical protein